MLYHKASHANGPHTSYYVLYYDTGTQGHRDTSTQSRGKTRLLTPSPQEARSHQVCSSVCGHGEDMS